MTFRNPSASDAPESLADWLEFQALVAENHRASLEGLVRVLRRTGSADAIVGPRGDAGSEATQAIAQDAFAEIEARVAACGGPGRGYPFEVDPGSIQLVTGGLYCPYVFLLLLSSSTPTSGHNGTAALFERLCCVAAWHYLGGARNSAAAVRFGAPRRPPLATLGAAVDDLCVQCGEGGGCLAPEKATHTGDDGLDLVVWRSFPDGRAGKLIAFGQCAAGRSGWEDKLAELDGLKFSRKWFRHLPLALPIRMFFLPWRLESDDWEHSGIDAGIVFDRCRVVACLNDLDDSIQDSCGRAVSRLLEGQRHP